LVVRPFPLVCNVEKVLYPGKVGVSLNENAEIGVIKLLIRLDLDCHTYFYFIDWSALQRFSQLRKRVSTHDNFARAFELANQLLTSHSIVLFSAMNDHE